MAEIGTKWVSRRNEAVYSFGSQKNSISKDFDLSKLLERKYKVKGAHFTEESSTRCLHFKIKFKEKVDGIKKVLFHAIGKKDPIRKVQIEDFSNISVTVKKSSKSYSLNPKENPQLAKLFKKAFKKAMRSDDRNQGIVSNIEPKQDSPGRRAINPLQELHLAV